jgi:hypothetical protein
MKRIHGYATHSRAEYAIDMTAVDSLKSSGKISEAHEDGIKKMTPLFADLIFRMSDEQKKVVNNLFRHSAHKHGHKFSRAKRFKHSNSESGNLNPWIVTYKAHHER